MPRLLCLACNGSGLVFEETVRGALCPYVCGHMSAAVLSVCCSQDNSDVNFITGGGVGSTASFNQVILRQNQCFAGIMMGTCPCPCARPTTWAGLWLSHGSYRPVVVRDAVRATAPAVPIPVVNAAVQTTSMGEPRATSLTSCCTATQWIVAAAAATTASSWGPMRGKAPEHLWRGALGPVIGKG
jgi:hypothetical protein